MGFMTSLKAGKAYKLQRKGEKQEAIRLYEEAFAEGFNDARYNLAYALLIIRDGQYQKAKDFLVKRQKTPMSTEQRVEMLTDYAACCFRLGNIDKGIRTLEEQFRKTQTGLIYQTLGYLYVEKYDATNKPDFAKLAAEAAAAKAEEAEENETPEETAVTETPETDEAAEAAAEGAETSEVPAEAKEPTPEEAWNAGVAKAEQFIRESIEYDDEDPICLDNMGQFLYRVLGQKEEARAWFDKAIERKPGQIDTLYFLSRYDEEAGDRAKALERMEKAAEGRFSPLNYCTREMAQQEIERLKGAL